MNWIMNNNELDLLQPAPFGAIYLEVFFSKQMGHLFFIYIPTTTSVVAETVALAHRPGLGPQIKVTQDGTHILLS